MQNKSEQKAREITAVLNDFSFDAAAVAKAMASEHKTLQQSFTRLCVEWLKVLVDMKDWQVDARNEASREIARELLDGKELPGLPFI